MSAIPIRRSGPTAESHPDGAEAGEVPVAIAGAGPVGLSTALGLARAGIRSVVLESKTELDPHSRATLILPRTLEIFRQWAVLDQLLASGNRVPHVRLREPEDDHQILHVNFTKLADQTACMFTLAIPQDRTERILLDAVQATGLVDVRFDTELVGFAQDSTGVRLCTQTGGTETIMTASYLVGADGAHSRVRGQLGVELAGKTYPTQAMLADVRIHPSLDRTDEWPTILDHRGIIVGIRFGDGVWRIIEQAVDERLSGLVLDDHIITLAQELFGTGPVEVLWRSIYHKHERCADGGFHYDRITLAGDAGHLNSPAGGQGMNSGVQDAHNLAWKLAAAVTHPAADATALLESYSQERTSLIGRRVQPATDLAERFQTARPHRRVALVHALDALFGFGHSQSAGILTHGLSMLDVVYEHSALLHGRSKALGHRVPDVLADDGERIYPKIPAGGVLVAGPRAAAQVTADELGLPLVNADVAALTSFFHQDQFVALIRPDHIVGAVADPTDSCAEFFAAALGQQPAPEASSRRR
jgi:2-polyprenyl-6-methoxyphenol hydroxylase-like FAD-dependent oxidoreductase